MNAVRLLGVLLLPLTVACGPIAASAPMPRPNILAVKRLSGVYKLDLSGTPDGTLCTHHAKLRDFCVDGFRSAYQHGLGYVLGSYLDGRGSDAYVGTFRIIEFSNTIVPVNAVSASLRWQFTLTNAKGEVVVALAETTVGPRLFTVGDDLAVTVGALVDATLEQIGKAVSEAVAKS